MKKVIIVLALVFCALMLASCGISNNPIDVQSKLEKEGYHCLLYGGDSAMEEIEWIFDEFEISDDGIQSVLVAFESSDSEGLWYGSAEKYLVIVFCEDAASAKKIEKDFISSLDDDDWVEYVKDAFRINRENEYKAGRNGKVVYIGHTDLIKAAK